VYPGHETNYAIKFTYGKSGVVGITRGPRLTPPDLDTLKRSVESELLTPTGTRVGKEILFSHLPVKGYFRYRDMFQIVPIPEEAPRPDVLAMGRHPFLLEFQFPTSTNSTIRHIRRRVRAQENQLVVAGLLEGSIQWFDGTVRRHWVLLPHEPGEVWRTAYCQEMYTSSSVDLESDDLSSTEGLPRLTEHDPNEYYTRSRIGSDQQFQIPLGLGGLLDRFFMLSKDDKERFLRACFWFQHSRIVHSYSRSASFTALISAVEARVQH
jgi:hypothetical protein